MNYLTDRIKPMFIKLLVASSGSAVVCSVFAMMDAMMIGRYHGPDGTAAIAVFNPIWSFVYCLGFLTGIGGSVLFANCRGKREEQESNEFFTATIIYGIILALISAVAISLFSEQIFRFFGADDKLLELTEKYFACIRFAIPCCVFSNLLSALLRNDNDSTLAMVAVILGGIINAIGDYIFVFVCDMGIFGAGLGTSIGLYASNFFLLIHFFRKRNTYKFVKPKRLFSKLAKITRIGFPTAITDLALGIVGVMFNKQIMRYLDSNALSVYGVLTQVSGFAQCIAYGVGQAAQPILSQNLGAKKISRIKECYRYGLITSFILGAFWLLLALSFPNMFIRLFMTPTDEVLTIAPAIIRAYGISFLILPFNIFATYYFQAILKPRISTVTSLSRGAFVSGIMIFVLPLIIGANGVWYAMLFAEIVTAVYVVINLKKCNREINAIA